MSHGGLYLEKIFPEQAEAAKRDDERHKEDAYINPQLQAKEFERRLRAPDTLPPPRRTQDD